MLILIRRTRPIGISFTKLRQYCSKSTPPSHKRIPNGPGLKDFIAPPAVFPIQRATHVPYLSDNAPKRIQKVYFDVYGCQMNVNDTEIVWSILKDKGFVKTEVQDDADVFLVMTCAIREGAESKIWTRLDHLRGMKRRRAASSNRGHPVKIGILGCMAERLKEKLIEKEKCVDIVAGPDSYRDLPRLLALTESGQAGVNVLLSLDETYADVVPVRLNQDAVTAFVSIMRGCDNMCTYCIVPFTRGRERSRPITSVVEEVRLLSQQGVREVTLLGQNVNSYRDLSEATEPVETKVADGFRTVYKKKKGGLRFADLLDKVSAVDPEMRIRFTSPHPKDFPDEVLQVISERDNICNMLHLPAQSGNSAVLERMRRGYTREAYLALVDRVRDVIPGVGLSSDFICGFCGETDEEFEDTITLMDRVGYNVAYLFPYSMRECEMSFALVDSFDPSCHIPLQGSSTVLKMLASCRAKLSPVGNDIAHSKTKTTAHRRYADDVPEPVKKERHHRMVEVFRRRAERLNRSEIGGAHLVLVEGRSKRSDLFLAGRNEHNIRVIMPRQEVQAEGGGTREMRPGDYVAVEITDANSQVLKGTPMFLTSVGGFARRRLRERVL